MRRAGIILLAGAALRGAPAAASTPEPASTRAAFEAMYPKTSASAAALEIEKLAAGLGIDLAHPEEKEPREHEHPTAEAAQAYEAVSTAISSFLDRELKNVEERIGAPPAPLASFLKEQDGVVESIRAATTGDREITWGVDVTQRAESPMPNLAGQLRIQRLLMARSLVQARAGEPDAALQTLEASWRLMEGLRERPELISQLVALAASRLQAGVLRKIDAPAYVWPDRLRSQRALECFAAVVANQVWLGEDAISDLTGQAGGYGRMCRRVTDELLQRDACQWTAEGLRRIVEEAAEAELSEDEALVVPAMPSLLNWFERVRRVMIDSELTALVLDARGERAASRRKAWPEKLITLGAGVCPREAWSYKTAKNGTVTVSFGGRSDETDVAGVRLPFAATAGIASVPARKPPARKPPAHRVEPAATAVPTPAPAPAP
ncbi:MAG: hypothetical protein ABI592_08895 [Acidobacteriota bacterium]